MRFPLRPALPILLACSSALTAISVPSPILQIPADASISRSIWKSSGDVFDSSSIAPGSSNISFYAKLDLANPRSPTTGWNLPAIYGGFQLYTDNQSNGGYLPNFLPYLVSPAEGEGFLNLSVTEIFKTGTNGRITNSISGVFLTQTSLDSVLDGEFRFLLRPNTIDHVQASGGIGSIRGLIYDGTSWLVTAAVAESVSTTVDRGAWVSTRSGWYALDIDDFTVGITPVTPAGPVTAAGLWFAYDETSPVSEVGFMFSLANTYFTPREIPTNYHPDTNDDGAIELSELLRVIELYNTRNGSNRTGRYQPASNTADLVTPDNAALSSDPALFDHYYAADTERNGSISLSELLRVIEIYNQREGSNRLGRFHYDATSDDGISSGTE